MQVLRKDQNQTYEALAQYKREMKPLPEGYMPATAADRISCKTQAEETFLKNDNGASFYEWVLSNCIVADKDSKSHLSSHTAAGAALFLCSLELRDVGEEVWEIYVETLRLKYQMDLNNPYVVDPGDLLPNTPQQIHPDSAKEPATRCTPAIVESDTSDTFPLAMPIRAKFSWLVVNKESAVQVTSHQISQWKQTPHPLQGKELFFAEVDGSEEAFKVYALLIVGEDRVFYVQFVDEDEAIAFSNDHFFEMLKEAKQVVTA